MAALTFGRVGTAELRTHADESGQQVPRRRKVKGRTERALSIYIHSSNPIIVSSGVNAAG